MFLGLGMHYPMQRVWIRISACVLKEYLKNDYGLLDRVGDCFGMGRGVFI